MTTELKLIIPGEPCAQGRPKFSTFGGHVKAYDPEKSRNYKAFVKMIAMEEAKKQMWLSGTELPLEIEIEACLTIPSSKPKKFKQRALDGLEMPTKKPDIDNIFKCITDALSGIAYKDDKQIIRCSMRKRYADEPCIIATVRILA